MRAFGGQYLAQGDIGHALKVSGPPPTAKRLQGFVHPEPSPFLAQSPTVCAASVPVLEYMFSNSDGCVSFGVE